MLYLLKKYLKQKLHLQVPFTNTYSGGHGTLIAFTKNFVNPQDSSHGT